MSIATDPPRNPFKLKRSGMLSYGCADMQALEQPVLEAGTSACSASAPPERFGRGDCYTIGSAYKRSHSHGTPLIE